MWGSEIYETSTLIFEKKFKIWCVQKRLNDEQIELWRELRAQFRDTGKMDENLVKEFREKMENVTRFYFVFF